MSVIGFYEIIEDAGLSNLLIPVKYEAPTFINSERVCDEILNAVRDQKRIFVIGDYDVDGMMCDLIFRDGLQLLGAQNVTFYKYRKRTHSLDPVAVQQCIQNQSDYCVIADCGSNNLGLLKKLNTYGIKVILLDHHETAVTYDEFFENGVIAINTTLEPNVYKLSAGALCYCVMSEILRRVNIPEKNLAVFAVISLYADCMDMHDDLNRAIYYRAKQIPKEELPHDVTMFMNEYQVLSARFINFWFAPRINAMFRAERFDVLNKLFIDPVDTVEMAHCLNLVEELYVHVRDMVTKVADIIEVTELENMVISNLYSVNEHVSVKENKLWNYTVWLQINCQTDTQKLLLCYVIQSLK